MFPGITRADADKDVRHCLQYLANFGYYKFGLEVTDNIPFLSYSSNFLFTLINIFSLYVDQSKIKVAYIQILICIDRN